MFQSPISYCDPVYRVLLVYAFTRNFDDYQVMLALALWVLVSVQVKIRQQSLVPGSRRPTPILNKTFGTTLKYKMAITNYPSSWVNQIIPDASQFKIKVSIQY